MLMKKIKDLTENKGEESNKKKIENLVVLVIILIITIMIINFIWNDDKKEGNITNETKASKQLASYTENNSAYNINEENELESKLQNILKSINGVGNVNVFLNYSETSTIQAMYNENVKESVTEEEDTSGGNRKIQETDTQKEIIYTEEDGDKKPITQKISMPKIEGAIITAEGASNSEIRTNIIQAVEAVTGLATHKIQVFEMSK